jgi:hypothetical protein
MNNLAIEVHAPSLLALLVGVLTALVAVFFYINPTVSHHVDYAFYLMTLAYVVTSLFSLLRT